MVLCVRQTESRIEFTPCLLVEVLSESTEQIDLSVKLGEYTQLESLERYIIIARTSRLVIVYSRQGSNWQVQTLEAGNIEIPCLDAVLSLEQIYAGIEVAQG